MMAAKRNFQIKLEARSVDISVCSMISEAVRQKDTNNNGDSVLPSNFPFNSPAATRYMSLKIVHDLVLSHRDKHHSYIDGYLALHQLVHPIIDIPHFLSMVDKFWNDPLSVDTSWLASFLMVLALGCFTVSQDQDSTVNFCMAAEACLAKTPFMVEPDLSAIRTLCLMVIAKQTTNTTCRTFDSCWTFLGIVMRSAVSMGLNSQPKPRNQSAEAIHEWKSGKTLWSLIVYFCIHMATITGKLPLISTDDIVTKYEPFSYSNEKNDLWISLLEEVYPTICHIICRVNSDTEKPSYDEVVRYNDQVRRLMAVLDTIRGRQALYIALDIFFRRILLVLHRLHVLDPRALFDYPVSYWSSIESSLAILVHHRDLCEHKERGPDNMDLLGRLFKLDFFSAMLTVCLDLLRHDTSQVMRFTIPPRQIILETLQACTDIWEKEIHHSACFRIGHLLLTSILRVLSNVDH